MEGAIPREGRRFFRKRRQSRDEQEQNRHRGQRNLVFPIMKHRHHEGGRIDAAILPSR